jgi:hypothetical protein
MENIQFYPNGFLKNAEYSSYYYSAVKDLDVLSKLENVKVELSEEPIVGNAKSSQFSIKFSDDGKIVDIRIPFQIYMQPNHKFSSPPTPNEVIKKITRVLTKADENYKEEFPNSDDEPKMEV